MPDLSVFSKFKSFNDYQDEARKNSLAEALTRAQIENAAINAQVQIMNAQTAAQKAAEVDVGKLGQQAFLKAVQGIPLTPQEDAALQYTAAKEQTTVFDPITQTMARKPDLYERAGLKRSGGLAGDLTAALPPIVKSSPLPPAPRMADNEKNAAIVQLFGGDGEPIDTNIPFAPTLEDRISQEADRQRSRAGGNRRLLQRIDEEENAARIKLITDAENKKKSEAERYSKTLESTGLTELVQAAERANRALPPEGQDIPGVGAYGGGTVPDIFTSDEGVALRQEIAGLKNALLKARSGGAVTPGEADRMMNEIGIGLGRNDKNLRQGIKNLTELLQEKIKNAGAGYSKEAKDLYLEQGGTITPDRLSKFQKGDADFKASKIATPEEIAEFKRKHGLK